MYALKLTDETGLTGTRLIEIRLTSDPAPIVTLLRPAAGRDPAILTPDAAVPVHVAADDKVYAVRRTFLEYRVGRDGPVRTLVLSDARGSPGPSAPRWAAVSLATARVRPTFVDSRWLIPVSAFRHDDGSPLRNGDVALHPRRGRRLGRRVARERAGPKRRGGGNPNRVDRRDRGVAATRTRGAPPGPDPAPRPAARRAAQDRRCRSASRRHAHSRRPRSVTLRRADPAADSRQDRRPARRAAGEGRHPPRDRPRQQTAEVEHHATESSGSRKLWERSRTATCMRSNRVYPRPGRLAANPRGPGRSSLSPIF